MKEEKMVKKAIIGRTLAAMIVSLMGVGFCGNVEAGRSEPTLTVPWHEVLVTGSVIDVDDTEKLTQMATPGSLISILSTLSGVSIPTHNDDWRNLKLILTSSVLELFNRIETLHHGTYLYFGEGTYRGPFYMNAQSQAIYVYLACLTPDELTRIEISEQYWQKTTKFDEKLHEEERELHTESWSCIVRHEGMVLWVPYTAWAHFKAAINIGECPCNKQQASSTW